MKVLRDLKDLTMHDVNPGRAILTLARGTTYHPHHHKLQGAPKPSTQNPHKSFRGSGFGLPGAGS
jgi:hypothetical protein